MPRKAPAPPPTPSPEPRAPAPEFEGRVHPQRSSVVDPEVKKPLEVSAASTRADEIWNQVYGNNQESPAGDQVSPETPSPSQEEESSAGDTQEAQTEEHFEEQPQQEQWEHRYNSMRGRYEQMAEQNRELMNRMSWFERQMQAQRQAAPAPAPAASPLQRERPQLVTKEETDEYGADFLDLIGRRAREDITPEIATLKNELKALRQQVGHVGTHIAMDARGRMEAELDQSMPEWRDINMEQDFLDWLSLPDAYSGANRHQLLKQAFEQNQTPRVAAFFQGFLREATASRPAEVSVGACRAEPSSPAAAERPCTVGGTRTREIRCSARGALGGKTFHQPRRHLPLLQRRPRGEIRPAPG